MFTGLVTDIGEVLFTQRAEDRPGDLHARIRTRFDTKAIDIGASIASDGVCLTVTALGPDWYEVAISEESLSKTNLSQWVAGTRVNLERSLKLGDEIGGHLVSGHVDGVAKIIELFDEGDSKRVVFEAPPELARFIAQKGSVTLNGTSLTVNEVDENRFGVNLIEHTQKVTNWGAAQKGDLVNLEIDMLARYVERLQHRM